MTGYRFTVDCQACGSALEHVNGTATAGTEACAIARCSGCAREWFLTVHLRPLPRDARAAERKRAQRAA